MLENFLRPISIDKIINLNDLEPFQLGRHLKIYSDYFPNLSDIKVAIIGVGPQEANTVRKCLYQLSNCSPNLKIADLGNLAKTNTRTAPEQGRRPMETITPITDRQSVAVSNCFDVGI